MTKKDSQAPKSKIITYEVGEFVKIIHGKAQRKDAEFAFFLGSGCSVTSGIPDAKPLTHGWLEILKDRKGAKDEELHAWAAKEFDGYNEKNAAKYFTEVMQMAFNTDDDRQHEIESITDKRGSMPRLGYAKLAQLIDHDDYGKQFSTVLTTNFDDMVADALYLYTHTKPRVITHEILAEYAPVKSNRPLIFKVHGDAMLGPKVCPEDVIKLKTETKEKLIDLIKEKTLIFIGYGGYDDSIADLLASLKDKQPKGGIYWVGKEIPENCVGRVLKERSEVFHVENFDFDELMFIFNDVFKLGRPTGIPLEKMLETLEEDHLRLSDKKKTSKNTGEKSALDTALDNTEKTLIQEDNWFGIHLKANEFIPGDLDRANEIYKDGLKKIGEHPKLLGNYAIFLKNEREDDDGAEEYYKRALKSDPHQATILGNYASFLQTVRADKYGAEEYYKRALKSDPNQAIILGNYSEFLFCAGRDMEGWRVVSDMAVRVLDDKYQLCAQAVAYILSPDKSQQQKTLMSLKEFLISDARDDGFQFNEVLTKAEDFAYVDLKFATALAAVINEKAEIETLDAFSEWTDLE